MSPVPVQRPDGRLYRPRKIAVYAVTGQDGDAIIGVVVLGTHDVIAAQYLADEYARWQLGSRWTAVSPALVWWSDVFEYGVRTWADNPVSGRAGVHFAEIVEQACPGDLV